MRKAVIIECRLEVFGEDEPASDFAKEGADIVRQAIIVGNVALAADRRKNNLPARNIVINEIRAVEGDIDE